MKNFLSVGRQPAVLTARPPAGATVKESSRICENFLSIGQPDGPAERVVKNQVGSRKNFLSIGQLDGRAERVVKNQVGSQKFF